MSRKLFNMGKTSSMLRCLGKTKSSWSSQRSTKEHGVVTLVGRALAHKYLKYDEGYCIIHQKMWQMLETRQPISCVNRHPSPCHIAMVILLIGDGHPSPFPVGVWLIEVHDRLSRLLYKMDRSRICLQNHNKKGSLLLLATNHVQVRFTKSYHLKK